MKSRRMWEDEEFHSRRGKTDEKDLISKYKNRIYDEYTSEEEDTWFWDEEVDEVNEDDEEDFDDR